MRAVAFSVEDLQQFVAEGFHLGKGLLDLVERLHSLALLHHHSVIDVRRREFQKHLDILPRSGGRTRLRVRFLLAEISQSGQGFLDRFGAAPLDNLIEADTRGLASSKGPGTEGAGASGQRGSVGRSGASVELQRGCIGSAGASIELQLVRISSAGASVELELGSIGSAGASGHCGSSSRSQVFREQQGVLHHRKAFQIEGCVESGTGVHGW